MINWYRVYDKLKIHCPINVYINTSTVDESLKAVLTHLCKVRLFTLTEIIKMTAGEIKSIRSLSNKIKELGIEFPEISKGRRKLKLSLTADDFKRNDIKLLAQKLGVSLKTIYNRKKEVKGGL